MKNNSETNWRRLLSLSTRVVFALVMVGLLVIPVAVQANLAFYNWAHAWDFVASRFQYGTVIIPWDGTWVPFLQELAFDFYLWPEPQGCAAGETTRWAGNIDFGLHHVDNDPLDAPGFQGSQNLSLISCDRNGDGVFDNADLTAPPSPYDRRVVYAECDSSGTYCYVDEVNEKDVETPCITDDCLEELVTTIQINLDQDCDGEVDPGLQVPVDPSTGHPEMLCLYAEARTPTPAEQAGLPAWLSPLQARLSLINGHHKFIDFAFDPTAVELASFDAVPQGNSVQLNWETANEIDNVGFNIYRAETQSGQMVKINPYLIASQNLGSAAGAAYSFLDESAVPGATYYYWLEDIDAAGVATRQGPVVAKMGLAKALPGRPRPAPMPLIQ